MRRTSNHLDCFDARLVSSVKKQGTWHRPNAISGIVDTDLHFSCSSSPYSRIKNYTMAASSKAIWLTPAIYMHVATGSGLSAQLPAYSQQRDPTTLSFLFSYSIMSQRWNGQQSCGTVRLSKPYTKAIVIHSLGRTHSSQQLALLQNSS
jgi:hypothetical protein